MTPRSLWIAFSASIVVFPGLASAASLAVQVKDASGHPVQDAVVYAEPLSGQAVPKNLKPVEVEQRSRKFVPLVSVVQVGTDVFFPNNDTVRHHVYSFSPAKTFEIKLYSGKSSPETFDKPGTVVLGCNIHDQMLAYIQIVPTPYFGKTDAEGKVKLEGLAPGKYALKAWHYRLPTGAAVPEQAFTAGSGEGAASFSLNLKAQ